MIYQKSLMNVVGEYFFGVSTMYETIRAHKVARALYERGNLTKNQKLDLAQAGISTGRRFFTYCAFGKLAPNIASIYGVVRLASAQDEQTPQAILTILLSEGVRIGMHVLNEWRGGTRYPFDAFFRKHKLEERVQQLEK